MNKTREDIHLWIKNHLFDSVPTNIAVIDRDFNLVYANKAFKNTFGAWEQKKCYTVYKGRDAVCLACKSSETFKDGVARINEEQGYNSAGNPIRYIKHTVPMKQENGRIRFLIEMSTDITAIHQGREEYELLFNQVPCNILLIDKNFTIVKTNKRQKEMYGNIEGRYCYEVLKGFEHKCSECTAHKTFVDGKMHTGVHTWKSPLGETKHLQVMTLPVGDTEKHSDVVMEMAVDVTQIVKLEDELKLAHTFMESMIATSIDGIFALNEKGDVTIFNAAARRMLNVDDGHFISGATLSYMLPEGCLHKVLSSKDPLFIPETELRTINGDIVPARLAGLNLEFNEKFLGMAFFLQDIREVKQLEREKIDAERMAAVGATVAGLAHGVKNLLTALEGGLYMLNSGMKKSNIERIGNGLDMLNRNIERISMFVKAFLGFSKGREIRTRMAAPLDIAQEVVELYSAKAKIHGIQITCEQIGTVDKAAIDYEGMHECLTNLVGNAIDACLASDKPKGSAVKVKILEKDHTIIFEVADNGCGMDYDIKHKVFTTFFTTKGLGGTGIGLLMTKKIVHEHGGTIDLTSEPGIGTTFSIRLPRHRLPKIVEKEE
jgi:signal transduction histidine kinase